MFAKTKRILIETESREIFIVRSGGKSEVRGFCERCTHDAEMLMLDEAVSRSGTSGREIMRNVETGNIHFVETQNGHVLICSKSVTAGNDL